MAKRKTPVVDMREIARRMLAMTHTEIVDFNGIMTDDGGSAKPTRENVIETTAQYGKTYGLRQEIIGSVLDEIKGFKGFSRFKDLPDG